jgi:hypothetical protein
MSSWLITDRKIKRKNNIVYPNEVPVIKNTYKTIETTNTNAILNDTKLDIDIENNTVDFDNIVTIEKY